MEIEHVREENKGEFYLIENGKRIGELRYSNAGEDKFIIAHTEVYPGSSGKGLGKALVNAAARYARENSLKIIPLCPYAKKVLEGSDEYSDVLL